MKKLSTQLTIPVLIVMVMDLVFTLLGQPSEYWAKTTIPSEGNPLGFHLLTYSPYLFIGASLIYFYISYLLMKKLPLFISLPLALSLFLGHVWGSSTWLDSLYLKFGFPNFDSLYWSINVAYFILISIITSFLILKNKKIIFNEL